MSGLGFQAVERFRWFCVSPPVLAKLKDPVMLFDGLAACTLRANAIFVVLNEVCCVKKGLKPVDPIKIGLVGAGVFAGYHAQKIASSSNAELSGVFDLNLGAAQTVVEKAGEGEAVASLENLILASDAILIATPAVTHAQIAARVLRAGRHVYVEKPLALLTEEADALVQLADAKGVVLQVGHQERLVFAAMGLLDIAERPLHIEAVRAAPRSPQGRCEDVSVVYDLMIHDIDLANALFGGRGTVSAVQGLKAHTPHLDAATAKITYANDVTATLTASRCAEARKRTMKIVYPSGVLEIDFLNRTVLNETPFDIQLDVSHILPDPLQAANDSFIAAIRGEATSPAPGSAGADAVAVACLIDTFPELTTLEA